MHWSTSRLHLFLPCLLAALLAASATLPAPAATYVLPADPLHADRILADAAPLLLVGQVVGEAQADPAGEPFTLYRLQPERVLKNSTQEDLTHELTLRVPGGVDAAGRELWLPGVPRFRAGERVLLALTRQDVDSTLYGGDVYGVLHLALGAFYEELHQGHRLAQRHLDGSHFLDQTGQPTLVLPRSRDFDRFANWLEQRALAVPTHEAPAADYLLAIAEAHRGLATPESAQPAVTQRFRLSTIDVNGVPFNLRWPNFVSGTVDFFRFADGQPDLPGSGDSELQDALDAWNHAPDSQVRYHYAGTTSADGGLSSFDGINAILFENPNGYSGFSNPFFCDDNGGGFGTVALGGPWFDRSTPVTHSYGGVDYLSALGADIVTNTNSRCILDQSSAAAEVFAHEVGHTLGFSHACGDAASGTCNTTTKDEALMRAFAHLDGRGAQLTADDRAAVAFLYAPQQTCAGTATSLCLQQGRFRVEADWRRANGTTGSGTAVALTPDTGYFWFFNSQNVELVVKVLDGCTNNGHFWVFAGGLTNVEVDLTVTDTLTEVIYRATNPQGTPFQPIQDTSAFVTCP